MRQPQKLPEILSRQEVTRIIESTATPRHRLLLMVTYGGGLRLSEVICLRPGDLDREGRLIRVGQGKGKKDRYTLLSPQLLEELRAYWREYRPRTWLFEGAQAVMLFDTWGGHLGAAAYEEFSLAYSRRVLARLRKGISLELVGATLRQLADAGIAVYLYVMFGVPGETRDDAVGEAFDKTAKLLGLGYPGGPAVSALAEAGTPGRYRLPRPMIASGDLEFSFSGLKTAVLLLVRGAEPNEQFFADVARAFQDAIVEVLVAKCAAALESFAPTGRGCARSATAASRKLFTS